MKIAKSSVFFSVLLPQNVFDPRYANKHDDTIYKRTPLNDNIVLDDAETSAAKLIAKRKYADTRACIANTAL